MTFVSYAQNFEDVILWRALKQVDGGFYIDVGAAWPDEHSVTRAFYDRGWRGINIEPNPVFHRELEQCRTRDINLQLAVSEHEGELEIGIIEGTGLSTLDDAVAAQHQTTGWEVKRQSVQVTTLRNIWQQYVPSEQDVHFLKVDVEGLEEAVLRGMDWKNLRPWVVVVEATLPMSQLECHQSWEPILLVAGYQLAYADGLNRFYVSKERSGALLAAFKYPPNVFDGFKLVSQLEAETKAQEAETKAQEAETKAQEAETKAQEAETKAQEAETAAYKARMAHQAVFNSRPWYMLLTLCWAKDFVKWFVRGTVAWVTLKPGSRSRRAARRTLLLLRNWLLHHSGAKKSVLQFLTFFPRLKNRVERFHKANPIVPDAQQIFSMPIPTELEYLSPRARRVHADLKSAMAKRQEEQS